MSALDIHDSPTRFHPQTQHLVGESVVVQLAVELARSGVDPTLIAGIVAELTRQPAPQSRRRSAAIRSTPIKEPDDLKRERQRRYRERRKEASPNVAGDAKTTLETSPTTLPLTEWKATLDDAETTPNDADDAQLKTSPVASLTSLLASPAKPLLAKKERSPTPPKEKNSTSPSASLRSAGTAVAVPIENDAPPATPNPAKPENPDAKVFRAARQIFGPKEGGTVAKQLLTDLAWDIGEAMRILTSAMGADVPKQFVYGAMRTRRAKARAENHSIPFFELTDEEKRLRESSF